MPALFIFLGGILAALAAGLGAIGAHTLKSQLTPDQLQTFQTAVQYQMIHAIGLILVGIVNLHDRNRWSDASGWAMFVGVLLFSGFLYAWLATGRRFFVHLVPVGGTLFIIGWLLLAIGAWRLGRKSMSSCPMQQ